MKAQELRIGNFCAWGYLDETIYPERLGTIWNITNKSVLVKTKTHKHTVGIDRVIPIPLTEEWLVKFNAKLVKGIGWEHYYIDDDLSVDLSSKVAYICRYDEDAYPFPCEFVHQLQNLFYAKNNQELTINEKSPTI